MGFNPPVPQQDSNWEIRAAVLLSLFFQVLLIFLGPTRKRSSAPLFRLTLWSSYLLADWVADLALGLLLNNMGNIGTSITGSSSSNNDSAGSSSSPIIFAFWAPFLLLHLGGPDTITAYSVEDNELWNRHLIGLLFELFSACVIIFCSLRGNPLVLATMLMLVAGVIKYGERTYSLYAGSAESLRDSILGPPEPGPNYSRARLTREFRAKKRAGLPVELAIYDKQEVDRLELYGRTYGYKSVEARAYELFLTFRRLLVDVIISSKELLLSQAFFLERENLTPREAFEVIEVELNFVYDMVYTKASVAYTRAGWVLRSVCSACLVSALLIFFFLDKPGHQILPVDVGITYALLLGGLALDAAALLMIFFSNRAKVYLETKSRRLHWLARLRKVIKWWRTQRWSGTVSQMNLIRYCLEKPGPYSSNKGGKWWLMIVKMLGIEEIVDDFFFIRRVSLIKKDGEEESRLLDFIFHALKGPAQNLHDKNEIMEVCSRRGKGVIDCLAKEIKERLTGDDDAEKEAKFDLIMESVTSKDFDESLLLWHIATDLCRLEDKATAPTETQARLQPIGKTLSEYMLYLLVKQPDMLSATAGVGLRPYRDTCAEARQFFVFASKEGWLGSNKDKEDSMRGFLLSVNTSSETHPASTKGYQSKSVLFDAVILAKALRELDGTLMWEVVAGVWGEMLTYAAGKCRGRTHMRSLSRGGEPLTFVWLQMQHMGLSDMYEIKKEDRVLLIVHY